MNKEDKVNQLLSKIKETTGELLDDINTSELTAEELIVIATEMTLGYPITTIEYTQPVGIVDRTKVTFMLDDEFEFPLFGDEYYESED